MKVFLGPEDQIWSKKACLGNVVGIDNIGASWNGLEKKNTHKTRAQINEVQ